MALSLRHGTEVAAHLAENSGVELGLGEGVRERIPAKREMPNEIMLMADSVLAWHRHTDFSYIKISSWVVTP